MRTALLPTSYFKTQKGGDMRTALLLTSHFKDQRGGDMRTALLPTSYFFKCTQNCIFGAARAESS